MSFIHLHVHTVYSANDATALIPKLAARADELDMSALAITDHGNMHGVEEFYAECELRGVKPIIGCEVYVACADGKLYHLTLLAENNTGFCNLVNLVYASHENILNSKPAINKSSLAGKTDGLIALSGCIGGEVSRKVLESNYDDALASALEYKELFAPDCFFIEITTHGWIHNVKINPSLVKISVDAGLPVVATNDVHMVSREDGRRFVAIRGEQTNFEARRLYLMTRDEMFSQMNKFSETESAIDNANRIAERCNVDLAKASAALDPQVRELITPKSAPPPILEYVTKVSGLEAHEAQKGKWIWEFRELSDGQKKKLYNAIVLQHSLNREKTYCLPGKKEKRSIYSAIKAELAEIETFPEMPDLELKRLVEKYVNRLNEQAKRKQLAES